MVDYSSLDMSGEEIAEILQREESVKYKPHKLTITAVLNRTAFIKAIDGIFGQLSLSERMKLADNISPFRPHTRDDMLATEELIDSRLAGVCEYTYELIPDQYAPPWEQPEYLAAVKWYNTLSDEDKKKVDILKAASGPWA